MTYVKTLLVLTWSFLKVGFFGFGGGFAMIPLMHDIAVNQYHWLNETQFSAAIAVGQVTPGPVAISATFIGYKVAGFPGALLATLAIFTPSVVVMYVLTKFYLRVRNNWLIRGMMQGMVPVVVGLILIVSVSIAKPAIQFWWQVLIITLVSVMAIKKWVNYGVLIVGSMMVGIIVTLLRIH